jgi:3-deoxy-manno-octulosonate cytidylyltransferase (CMP-KDO synthetase)
MPRILGVVPARMGSSRFPGKPLAPLCGRPMIEHVYRSAAACDLFDEVVLATCDDEIARAGARFGARVVMTSPAHERASDRVAEAAATDAAEIVVMIQGDEPMLQPGMIAAAIAPLLTDSAVVCTNLAAGIASPEELDDTNTIKLVTARDGRALYFSRQPIPTRTANSFIAGEWLKQVCVIPFRRDTLHTFGALPPGRLEQAESIDMLRLLEHGIPVHAVRTDVMTYSVDTPGDLQRVERLLAASPRAW